MAYREYKFGTMMIGTLFVIVLSIVVLFPSLQMAKIPPDSHGGPEIQGLWLGEWMDS